MTGNDLFDSLEYLDDDLLRETGERLKTKPGLKKRRVMRYSAAAVFVVFMSGVVAAGALQAGRGGNASQITADGSGGIVSVQEDRSEISATDGGTAGLSVTSVETVSESAAVYVDGEIYLYSGAKPLETLDASFEYIGAVEKEVTGDVAPAKNWEASDIAAGSEIYRSGQVLAVHTNASDGYQIYCPQNDLVYRDYDKDSGLDLMCGYGETVTITWNADPDVLPPLEELLGVFLKNKTTDKRQDITESFRTKSSITVTESGNYILFAISKDGVMIDLSEAVSLQTDRIGNSTGILPLSGD